MPRVLVIGGGHNGLVCAAYLARAGAQVTVLERREPDHPNVRSGQWLKALMRQFYADIAKRCDGLARFERDRRDRKYLKDMAGAAQKNADFLASSIEIVVDA